MLQARLYILGDSFGATTLLTPRSISQPSGEQTKKYPAPKVPIEHDVTTLQ